MILLLADGHPIKPLPDSWEYAGVLCVDEKPQIQAFEWAQGWFACRPERVFPRLQVPRSYHPVCRPQVATVLVKTRHYKRQRRHEFLDFMNTLVAHYGPEQHLHMILDNRNTHKPKDDRWLNQVETWLSILSRRALLPASFTSPGQVRQAIDRFMEAYNPQAAPFEWTKTTVVAGTLKQSYADL